MTFVYVALAFVIGALAGPWIEAAWGVATGQDKTIRRRVR